MRHVYRWLSPFDPASAHRAARRLQLAGTGIHAHISTKKAMRSHVTNRLMGAQSPHMAFVDRRRVCILMALWNPYVTAVRKHNLMADD